MRLHFKILEILRRRLGVHVYRVFARDAGAAKPLGLSGEELQYRVLDEAQALQFSADPELDLNEAQIRAAYASGAFCVGALDRERLVGYIWLSFADTPHTSGVSVHFGPEARYSYKHFVLPGYRGRRIQQRLHQIADEPSLRAGRALDVFAVALDNRASLAAARHGDARAAGFAGYLQLGRPMLFWRSRKASALGFSFVPTTQSSNSKYTKGDVHMNFSSVFLAAVIAAAAPLDLIAAAGTVDQAGTQQAHQLADGEVRKVDKAAGKMTIRHGAIPSMDMPPMTMVYHVQDRAMLDRVKAGDKIRFDAAKVNGQYTVTKIEGVN